MTQTPNVTAAIVFCNSPQEGAITMTDAQQPQPLWTDENIMNDARRATSNPTAQAQIRSCLLFMRHGYEAERQQLTARIQELERELAEARSQQLAGQVMPQPDSPQTGGE